MKNVSPNHQIYRVILGIRYTFVKFPGRSSEIGQNIELRRQLKETYPDVDFAFVRAPPMGWLDVPPIFWDRSLGGEKHGSCFFLTGEPLV